MAFSVNTRPQAHVFNLRFVLPSLFGFLAIVVLVMTALSRMASLSNQLDDDRAVERAVAALQNVPKELSSVLQENAVRSEADQQTLAGNEAAWFDTAWCTSTATPTRYDTVLVFGEDGKAIYACRAGRTLPRDASLMDPSFLEMVAAARASEDLQPRSGFVRSGNDIYVTAVQRMAPGAGPGRAEDRSRHYLALARRFDASAVENLARNFLLQGMQLVEAGAPRIGLSTDIRDPRGITLASLVWQPRSPGDESYAAARPLVLAALGVVAAIIVLLIAHGWFSIAKLTANEAEARRRALHDPLTGLANRAGLTEELARQNALASADGETLTLLYFDLDGFKEINDAYGHGTGDQLLRCVAAGLKTLAPSGALLSRVGGDEFALVLPERAVTMAVHELADIFLDFFTEPFELGDRVAPIGTSIGIAESFKGDISTEELVRRADLAMYQAKDMGGGRVVTYEPSMDGAREERNAIETDLRDAIARSALTIEYQPLVRAQSGSICGVEALARWHRAGHGPVRPDVFIPIAESTGLIESLGLYVLRQACLQGRRWPHIKISVNVSPAQFRNPDFPRLVAEVLQETETAPERVTLEVTEGYLISHPDRARRTIALLKRLGVSISLDDFGAGFSSVGYLRQFGFDRLKIDRSMIVALDNDAKAAELVQATVGLAAALDIPVTAEGIEREDQAAIMRLSGCDELQGYLFGRPMSADEVSRMVERERPLHLVPNDPAAAPSRVGTAA